MRPARALVILTALTLGAGALSSAQAASAQPTPSKPVPPRPRFVPGEVLVRYRAGTVGAERAAVRARHGVQRVRSGPLPRLELVRIRGAGSPPQIASRLEADPAVRDAEPNFLWYPDQLPDDPEFAEQWGLHNTGQTDGLPDVDIDWPEGWALAADASDRVVAVIDTGVWTEHPDLQGQIWTNPGEVPDNGLDDDDNGYVDDVHGWDFFGGDATGFDPNHPDDHGTHVAGTIAAAIDNAQFVTGVSPARIMPLKFLGPQGGSTLHAIEAIHYAIDQEVDVINASWGGGPFSTMLRSAIEEANQAGILFVAAAGNDGVDNDLTPHYPANYDTENIISVAATTQTDALSNFSNYGDVSVDLGAPGEGILSTVPRFAKAVLAGPDTGAPVDHRSAYHSFGLEGIASLAHREAILDAALTWMEVDPEDPVLLVDDDRGEGFESSYVDALQALGYTNRTQVTVGGCGDGPDQATLNDAEVVIWFTGSDYQCTLTATDQSRLSTYLAGGEGRNLLLFGQDIGYDIVEDTNGQPPSTFLRDDLLADYVEDMDHNLRPSGMPGTPYEDVPTIWLSASGPGHQSFTSSLEPREGAVAGMRGAHTAWLDGTSMAAPHVAGSAVLVMATHPSLGHLEVRARILERGDPVPALAGKTVTGRRLNLEAALKLSAPEDLSAQARPEGRIDLSWTPSDPQAVGYNVYRGTTSDFPPTPGNRIATLVSDPSYSDTDTVDGATYYYVVRAEDMEGNESESSNEASAAADATPPQALLDHLPRFQRDRSFDVSWSGADAGSGVESFRVETRQAPVKGPWSPWDEWRTTADLSATFAGKPGQTVCFRVAAADAAGNEGEPGEAACTAVPANDRSFQRKGAWRDRKAAASYLGTFTESKRRGDKLVVGRVRARAITLLHTRCKACGRIEVLFKGKVLKRLSLRAPKLKRGAVRRLASFDGLRGGKLVLVVRSKGKRVPIEGVGISRI